MKTLVSFVMINFVIFKSAYSIEEKNGKSYQPYQIEFDSNSKRYELVSRPDCDCDRLYIFLDSKNEILSLKDFYHIWKIMISKKNDVFIFASNATEHNEGKQSLWRLDPKDYRKINYLFTFNWKGKYNDTGYFIDKDGFIYFNTQEGVAALKPNENKKTYIKDLEGFSFDEPYEDEDGNVFLDNNKNGKEVIISKESKGSSILTGEYSSFKKSKKKPPKFVVVKTKNGSGLSTVNIILIVVAIIIIVIVAVIIKKKCFK